MISPVSSQVVNIGRYRMLKDTTTGKILKTKSEVSALQDFISWLEVAKGDKDGVILICHEHERKVSSRDLVCLQLLIQYVEGPGSLVTGGSL